LLAVWITYRIERAYRLLLVIGRKTIAALPESVAFGIWQDEPVPVVTFSVYRFWLEPAVVSINVPVTGQLLIVPETAPLLEIVSEVWFSVHVPATVDWLTASALAGS